MTVQSTTSTLESSQKAAASFANLIELWSSTIYTSMHSRNDSKESSAGSDLLRSVLTSNKEFAAFSIYRASPEGRISKVSLEFTPYRDSLFFEKTDADSVMKKLEGSAQRSAQAIARGRKESPTQELPEKTIKNLSGDLSLEIIELTIPFKLENSSDIEVATLHVWSERIRMLIEKKANLQSFVVSLDGRIFLSADQTEFPAGSPYTSKSVSNLASRTVPNSLDMRNDSNGIPVIEGATAIPGTDLAFVIKQNSKEIFDKIIAQMRNIALVSWMFLLVTILASYIASGRVTKKIQETVAATLRIASGDLNTRVLASSKDEVGILAFAVNHMASRIRNLLDVEVEAARQEKELKTAQAVQQTLFKENSRQGDSIVVTGFFEPASECAGDWWFDIKLSETKHLVIVADATGHGASAALVVAVAFSYFQTLAMLIESGKVTATGPAEMLADLNRLMVQSGKGKTTMTMFLGEIDSQTLQLRYANAGHVAPLLIPLISDDDRLPKKKTNPAKSRLMPLIGGGVMLGFDAASSYEEKIQAVRPGDRVFFYTDGLIECMGVNGESITAMELRRQLAELAESEFGENMCDSIIRIAHERLGNTARNDDLTVVVAEVQSNQMTVPGELGGEVA